LYPPVLQERLRLRRLRLALSVRHLVWEVTEMKVDLRPRLGFAGGPYSYTVRKRLQQDRTTFTAFLGEPRSSKSNDATVLGESVSQNDPFRARDITFLPRDYIKSIIDAKPGDYRQFDEPGAEWGARAFMSVKNKMLNATHITFGSKLITVGWAVPVLTMEDKIGRQLINYVFITRNTGPKGITKFYQNWVNPYTGKTGRTGLGTCWWAKRFPDRPEEETEYLEMKKQYQDEQYAKYYADFAKEDDDFEAKSEDALTAFAKALAELSKDPKPYYNSRGHVDSDLLSTAFPGLTDQKARVLARRFTPALQGKQKPP
jgi:hypothetical protein